MKNLRTSVEWWDELLIDYDKMISWLQNQYLCEFEAGERILSVFGEFDLNEEDSALIKKVAQEENDHARWIGDLLDARKVPVNLVKKPGRYWEETQSTLETVEDAAAVGYLAENMRLERILAISECDRSPHDIKLVMKRIYVQEVSHTQVFEGLTNKEAVENHIENHNKGRNALGLVA